MLLSFSGPKISVAIIYNGMLHCNLPSVVSVLADKCLRHKHLLIYSCVSYLRYTNTVVLFCYMFLIYQLYKNYSNIRLSPWRKDLIFTVHVEKNYQRFSIVCCIHLFQQRVGYMLALLWIR